MNDIKNMAASVRARLYNQAQDIRMNFDQILLLYLQERLLARLSKSAYRDHFYLKGGLWILSRTNIKTRPTKDIDFLAKDFSNDLQDLQKKFSKICTIALNDGVVFDMDSITTEKITEDADYEGARIKITAYLGRARKSLQLDIGFSDVIVPTKGEVIGYPTLLSWEQPQLKAYSKESVVAEKFEAMLKLSELNSRMKDFYDVLILSETKNFDGRFLQEAVFETLQKRGTSLVKEPSVFREGFYEEQQRIRMWENYLKKIRKKPILFSDVMKHIKDFLCPIYKSIIRDEEFFCDWNPERKKWHKKVD